MVKSKGESTDGSSNIRENSKHTILPAKLMLDSGRPENTIGKMGMEGTKYQGLHSWEV